MEVGNQPTPYLIRLFASQYIKHLSNCKINLRSYTLKLLTSFSLNIWY